jgi:hypothetical protein
MERHSERLQNRSGAEYDRAVQDTGTGTDRRPGWSDSNGRMKKL